MENWYREYPQLLAKEIEDLEKNGITVDKANIDLATLDKECVILNCVIPVENNLGLNLQDDLGLRIVFPSNYPYFRPEVFVTSEISIPRHQHPREKSLCLIPRPTQFWNVEDGIYKYLKERLPIVFIKGKITDQEVIGMDLEEQAEPVSEYYANDTNAVVLSTRPNFGNSDLPRDEEHFQIIEHGFLQFSLTNSENIKLVDTIATDETITTFCKRESNSNILKFVINKWYDSKETLIGEIPFNFLNQPCKVVKTKWYKISSLKKLLDNRNSFSYLISELASNKIQLPKPVNINTKNYKIKTVVALIFPEEEIAGKISWGWALFIDGYITKVNGQKQINPYPFPLILPVMSLDQSDLLKRIPNSRELSDKTISIVGLGSLGAPSALEFAKNGVKKLKLMDFDIVDTAASVRWPLGVESAGYLKTVALENFIKRNYPNVQVEIFNHKIGTTNFFTFPNENDVLEAFLKNSDLVYDASAEEGVSNLVSFLCKQKAISYIEIEGRRGAWGGLIMRVLPNRKKGCWMCLQYSLFDGTIPSPKEDIRGTVQPKGCGDLTFTGSSFDLQNLSLAGVRMAISALNKKTNNIHGDWDIAVLSLMDNENKPIAPKWETFSLDVNPKCPFCNANSLD